MLVSIIIPTLNEEEFIEQSITHILKMNHPSQDLEIIVVDNGSTDRTCEIAQGLGAVVHSEPHANVGKLRNIGSKIANAEIIGFVMRMKKGERVVYKAPKE